MFSRVNEDEKICAVLHDVVEDSDVTLDDLRREGFSKEIVDAIDCLTKRENETYDDFISRVLTNELACQVKLADLIDNADISRINEPGQRDFERIKKYEAAIDRILETTTDSAEIQSYGIEINGCIEVPSYISVDEFSDRFINFIEKNNWYFGGSIKEYSEE